MATASVAGDDRVFLVPLQWWREAEEGSGARGINFELKIADDDDDNYGSDLVFDLWRDEDARDTGRCYALLPSNLWSLAIKRHNELNLKIESNGSQPLSQDVVDVYPLMLRISVQHETKKLTVKISKKDNSINYFERASKIFTVGAEPVHIWDSSGQTNFILMTDWNTLTEDCHQNTHQEILLQVHVYGLVDMYPTSDIKKGEFALELSEITSEDSSFGSKDIAGDMDSDFLKGNSKGGGPLGLIGLENLGNTCFMNSAIQCLAHTPKLVDFFLGDYKKEINLQNPLGLKGELAASFGDLLRMLWAADRMPVVPRAFKSKLACFAPQFSGFSQHDSQELLAFLLDGLHEDLNRIQHKPYAELKDAAGRPDEEVAHEYWENHLARNDSIIVDNYQGQYKSTLVCPVCRKMSVTFDPFMYLSLPLPSTTTRAMTITVFSADGSAEPSVHTVNVPKLGQLEDLLRALSSSCSLRDDENLFIVEVFSNRILRFLEDPSDSITLIRNEDRLAAYRMPKGLNQSPSVVFVHQKLEENYFLGKKSSNWKGFGVPLMSKLPNDADGSAICKLFLKILNPFKTKDEKSCDNPEKWTSMCGDLAHEFEGCSSCNERTGEAVEDTVPEFEFYLTDEKSQVMQSKVESNAPILVTAMQKHIYVIVCWKDTALQKYDISLLSTLPDVYKFRFSKRPLESFTLYTCIEAFLKEEPLGPDDMWYCPTCKKHQQASKKLDLWRLPDVLVIHLKRFMYSQYSKTKLETYVDFPIHDLDLSSYILGTSNLVSNHYQLYAIINHYGNMGGGHYTAYAYHEGQNCWYNFDDRSVDSLAEENIKTSAAYVLFYRRK